MSKQPLMADPQNPQPSPTKSNNRPSSSFFGSPRFRTVFSTKLPLFETDGLTSPTSILDNYKPFSVFGNPFAHIEKQLTSSKLFSGNKRPWENNSESKGIAVALTDSMNDETICRENFVKSQESKLIFSNKLTVQIPTFIGPPTLSHSPSDFGIKTRNSRKSANGYANSGIIQTEEFANRVYTGWVSVSDVENSEYYTCVISRGPSPRKTHIFDNNIVEESYSSLSNKSKLSSTDNFLSSCYTCSEILEQKNNIYIYRGEKAFCSRECRYQEMLLDDTEFDDDDVVVSS